MLPRRAWCNVVFVLLAIGALGCEGAGSGTGTGTGTGAGTGTGTGTAARVTRVVDGDTIRVMLDGYEERVRYIGVNTPEVRDPFGDEATTANRRLVEGRTVRLEYDVDRRDRYGRLLAYVYLDDGTFVNAKLVELGFAQTMTVPPNVAHQAEFLRLEREARAASRGLWARP